MDMKNKSKVGEWAYKQLKYAINALTNLLGEYQKIGTPDECRAAVEKQKAKKCNVSGDGYADGHLVYDTYECPHCGKEYEIDYEEYEFCPNCGQHLIIELESDEE